MLAQGKSIVGSQSSLEGDPAMRAFIRFNQGLLSMPPPWQAWLLALMSANLIAPLFFLGRVEAQVAVAALVVSMVLMTILTGRFGFSRILGLGHIIAWVPLLAFLWSRLPDAPIDNAFGLWLRAVIALDAASLVIDVVDVVRFLAGDRAETVPDQG